MLETGVPKPPTTEGRMSNHLRPGCNARFEIYWNGTFTKITLRPGQTIQLAQGGPTDEGWESEQRTYHYNQDELCIECSICREGSDCDGRQTHYWEGVATEFFQDVFPDGDSAFVGDWQAVSSEQRDQFAELSGY